MSSLCEGRAVIVTGAGRGIGRGEALEFAGCGAKVVVNDLGANVDGTEPRSDVADSVVEEIQALGGEAVANAEDISSWEGSRQVVQAAIDRFGRLVDRLPGGPTRRRLETRPSREDELTVDPAEDAPEGD